VIGGLSDDLGEVVMENRLTSMRGIGDGLASQIEQLYLTGESSVLQGLQKEFPPGIIELSGVPGLSVGKIKTLHDALGIKSVAELKAAAEAGKIRNLKGFGAKTEEKLLETITSHRQRGKGEDRLLLHGRCKRRNRLPFIFRQLPTPPRSRSVAPCGVGRKQSEPFASSQIQRNLRV